MSDYERDLTEATAEEAQGPPPRNFFMRWLYNLLNRILPTIGGGGN
jgi:hypothetical protein